jgi:hypothetical protein
VCGAKITRTGDWGRPDRFVDGDLDAAAFAAHVIAHGGQRAHAGEEPEHADQPGALRRRGVGLGQQDQDRAQHVVAGPAGPSR